MIGKARKLQTPLYFKKLKIEIRVFCKTTNKKSELCSKIKPRKKAVNIKRKRTKNKKN
jgi:hypothetical protein